MGYQKSPRESTTYLGRLFRPIWLGFHDGIKMRKIENHVWILHWMRELHTHLRWSNWCAAKLFSMAQQSLARQNRVLLNQTHIIEMPNVNNRFQFHVKQWSSGKMTKILTRLPLTNEIKLFTQITDRNGVTYTCFSDEIMSKNQLSSAIYSYLIWRHIKEVAHT